MRSCLTLAALAACANDNGKLADDREQDTIDAVKTYVSGELDALAGSSADLCAALPAPDADGWSHAGDPDGVEQARATWGEVRARYEHVEGAIAILFPDLDVSTDQRYDGFLAVAPDPYLFDDEGVIGVHALERILWADAIPDYVVAFESAIPGYLPAASPSDEQEASDTRDRLCARLVTDTGAMRDRFAPLALDLSAAYGGVVGSMREQVEKVSLARTGEEESRYAQHTAADLRANLEGGQAIYAAFSPWVRDVDGGEDADEAVIAGFARVEEALEAVDGDAIPEVPEDWNPDAPTAADLDTPYGALWTVVDTESDPDDPGSLVSAMVTAASLVGLSVSP